MDFPKKIKKAIDDINNTVNPKGNNSVVETVKNLAPTGEACLRASIAAIPYIGGPLDHLLFDKYAKVQQKNMQQAVEAMKAAMEKMDEEKVSKEWFESEEALDMLKTLFDKIRYEGDKDKINTLSYMYCLFGSKEHIGDPNKYAVMEIVSKLTKSQRIVFRALSEVKEERKSGTGEAITYSATAIWQNSVLQFMQSNLKYIQLISGLGKKVQLDVELDILVSFNMLRFIDVPNMNDRGFYITALGKMALSYMKEIE